MNEGIGNAALIALLAIVPLVVLMLTSFVKLSVVLALLRNAIGSPDAPSGLVVLGLALVLTFFVMAPVAVEMIGAATSVDAPTPDTPSPAPSPAPSPVPNTPSPAPSPAPGQTPGQTPAPGGPAAPLDLESALRQAVPAQYEDDVDAAARAVVPLKAWMTKHVDAKDKQTFVDLAERMGRPGTSGDELWVLAPAFLATELREAFAIAVLIFLPFLVIDLVVGLALAALGLVNTQPQTITLPLKLLLFVAVDGWRLLLDSLLRGYA